MKGRKGYLPSAIVNELEDIKREDRVKKDVSAMMQLVKYARIGREVQRIKTLNWKRSVPRVPVEELFKNGRN